MASPEGESFYCISNKTLSNERGQIYVYVGISTAFLGFLGSLFQIVTTWKSSKKPYADSADSIARNESSNTYIKKSSVIVLWLAVSDLLACTMVIAKSVAFKEIERPGIGANVTSYPAVHKVYVYWGLPLEYLLRYFYVCTYLWTFCFAIDVLLKLKDWKPNEKFYHVIWPISLVLVGISVFLIVYHDMNECSPCQKLEVTYISSFWIPLVVVMAGNPIIYINSRRLYNRKLMSRTAFGNKERKLLAVMTGKFLEMTIVFYFCWWTSIVVMVVNLIDSCSSYTLDGTLLIISSFFNPLQGFLNCFSYGKYSCAKCLIVEATHNDSSLRRNTLSPDQSLELSLSSSYESTKSTTSEKSKLLTKQT
eukprot:m.311041 g.311041  ORF g.311041 m.311041 type:complete len:364 (+) comp58582_c0_seq1:50-1141(+)